MSAPSANSGSAEGTGDLADLILEVQDLRQRVLALEERLGSAALPPLVQQEVAPTLPTPGFELPPNVVPVLGRTLVAIAGAYVLRALTEWGVLPAAAGVASGLIYSLLWLWLAAREPAEAKFAVALNCSTSVLIMAPLIWEATERLKVMSSWTSAAVLAVFALIALTLGAGTRHGIIAAIGGISAIVMALALLLARHDIVPFTTAILLMAAAMEFAAWLDLPSGARAVAALAADASVLMFSGLMASRGAMPEIWVQVSPYAAFAAQLALALICMGTAVTQTVVRRRTLAFAEIVQTAAALLIGIGGAVWVFKEHRAMMLGLGLAALASGLVSYAVSFRLFERDSKWNFRAWAAFGLFLVLAGIFLPFSSSGFWILSCLCALASCWTAKAFRLPTLGLHGAVYLLLGSAAAGVTSQPLSTLFGVRADHGEWPVSLAVLVAAAVCWAAIAGIPVDVPGSWRTQITSLAIAAHVMWITAGLAAFAVLAMWRTGAPADTLGTVILTGLSLSLAWAATHWGRRELAWLLYGFMALGAYKLATRDFMNEHNLPLVISLLCYGGAMILLPQMLRGKSAATDARR